MDGNRRWASARGLPSIEGHRRGVSTLKNIVRESSNMNVKQLSVFGFSSENLKRPMKEVKALINLIEWYLKSEIAELSEKNVILKIFGQRNIFPENLIKLFELAENVTSKNTGLNLNVFLNYGGKMDLINAAFKISKEIKTNNISLDQINETIFRSHLLSSQVSDVDLLIRTSGEKRLSNFMMWQLSYAELYFSDTLWPDFTTKEYKLAIKNFSKRERRYGSSAVKEIN